MHAFTVDGGKTTSVPAFQIRWEEDDLSLLETNPLTPAAAATGGSENTPGGERSRPKSASPTDRGTGNGGGDSSSGDDNGEGKLPTGAVVGIAVGVALLVAIVLIAGFIWYRKRYMKAEKSGGQDPMENEKTNGGKGHPFNPEGAPLVYPDLPQEMEGSTKVAPAKLPPNGPGMSPVKGRTSQGHTHGHTVQQLDGSAVSRPAPPGISQHTTPRGNVPAPLELYSSITTMPTELESENYPASGTYPAEIDGVHQVPELHPQQGMGELHTTPVASELQASTVRPAKRRSGRTGWVSQAPDLGGFSRQM